jgi:hypothetical protein
MREGRVRTGFLPSLQISPLLRSHVSLAGGMYRMPYFRGYGPNTNTRTNAPAIHCRQVVGKEMPSHVALQFTVALHSPMLWKSLAIHVPLL